MAIGKTDLSKLQGFRPGGGGGANNWFKPKPAQGGGQAKYRIRICPPREGEDLPFHSMTLHYFDYEDEDGDKQFLSGTCPRMDGQDCPACDLYWPAYKSLEKGETDLREAIRGIGPNNRTYVNVVDREDGRVLVWGMPYTVASNIVTHAQTYAEDGVDITDPTKGYDMVIPVEQKGPFPSYGNVSVAPKPTPIGIEGWEDELHDLDAMSRQRELSPEEIEELIPMVLGEFYDEVMARAEDAPKSRPAKAHKKAKASKPGTGKKKKKKKKSTGKKKSSKKKRGRKV